MEDYLPYSGKLSVVQIDRIACQSFRIHFIFTSRLRSPCVHACRTACVYTYAWRPGLASVQMCVQGVVHCIEHKIHNVCFSVWSHKVYDFVIFPQIIATSELIKAKDQIKINGDPEITVELIGFNSPDRAVLMLTTITDGQTAYFTARGYTRGNKP